MADSRSSHLEASIYECSNIIIVIMRGDPSLEGGYVQLHQRQMGMSVRSESLSFQDSIMVRVFKSSQSYKVELTSQLNISFLYVTVIPLKDFSAVIEQEVRDELTWFQDIFSGQNKYQLCLESSEYAQLTVFAEEKFKNYELVSLDFTLADQSRLKDSVMYRYERMRARQRSLDNYWQGVCGVIRTKNPSLLLQLEHRIRKNAFK